MTPLEIRQAFSLVCDKKGLLRLLNRIKADEYGEKAHPFTLPQLNYFANSKRNADSYRGFLIPKKSGGHRIIFAPDMMLKNMLGCVNILLQAIYEPSESAMGFRRGKSVADNANAHTGRLYVFNSDISDFFPTITKQRVRKTFMSKPLRMNEEVADTLCNLCCTRLPFQDGKPARERCCMTEEEKASLTYRDVLPQGSPCSPVVSNMVCWRLDHKLSYLARKYRCRYTRYADDITFSSDYSVFSDESDFRREFERIVTSQGFSLNESKTRVQKRGSRQEVTGLVVGDKVNVPKSFTRDISSLLHIWEKFGYKDALVKFIEYHPGAGYQFSRRRLFYPTPYGPYMALCIRGKLNYLRMVKGENDRVYQSLNARFNKLTDSVRVVANDGHFFSAIFKIDEFERLIGGPVTFRKNVYTLTAEKIKPKWCPYSAFFSLNGTETRAYISRKCYSRIADQLEHLCPETALVLKSKLHISLCDHELHPFWLITEGRPYSSLQKMNHETRCFIDELGLEIIERSLFYI